MSEEKPYELKYRDPEGKEQTGWCLNGHVYQDEAATVPVAVGSLVPTATGWYRMTDYGGVLWADSAQENSRGEWVPQGNHWYRTAQDLGEQLRSRPGFTYDPEQDPLYRSARDLYRTEGSRAMEDTLGKAAQRTGGYSSSYGLQAGQQAYREQLSALSRLLPELYDRARSGYNQQTEELIRRMDQAVGLYDLEYRAYLDRVAAARKDRELEQEAERWQQDFDRDNDHWQQEFDRDNDRWQQDFDRDNDHWQQELALDQQELEQKQAASEASAAATAANRDRSYAFRMAMQALQQGLRVSDSLLQTAGIDKSFAETLRRYYASIRN